MVKEEKIAFITEGRGLQDQEEAEPESSAIHCQIKPQEYTRIWLQESRVGPNVTEALILPGETPDEQG